MFFFSDILRLTTGFKKPPTTIQQDKGKGIMKEDAPKIRKQREPPKEVTSWDFMGVANKSPCTQKVLENELLKRLDEMLDVRAPR